MSFEFDNLRRALGRFADFLFAGASTNDVSDFAPPLRSAGAVPVQGRGATVLTEALCAEFESISRLVARQQIDAIPERAVDDFVALGWMQRDGGAIRVTRLGRMALAWTCSRGQPSAYVATPEPASHPNYAKATGNARP